MTTNGNGTKKWLHWTVATIFSLITMVILFMGNTVKANDVENKKEHTAIRKELVEVIKESSEKSNEMRDCIYKMQTEILQRLAKIETKIER